ALGEAVRARALELGFDRIAIGPAEPPEHGAAFQRWLDAGYAGEMGYLERTRAERLDPARLLPGCRSVVAAAVSYNHEASATGAEGPTVGRECAPTAKQKIARYARGRDYHDVRKPDRCGTCTACLDACPTGAFVEPYILDARRCISYLTIEHRGDVPGELRAGIGEWLFGCDVCQDVCPWNRKAEPGHEPALE